MSMLGGGTQSKPTPPSVAMRVQTSVAGKCVPIVWGQMRLTGNLIFYSYFSAIPVSSGGKSGGKGGGGGGKGGKGGGTYDYSAWVMVGICEGPVANVLQIWNGPTGALLSTLNLTFELGSYSQGPWAELYDRAPSVALGYRGLCYVMAAPMPLGSSPSLPNLNYEIVGAINSAIPGYPDADPSRVVVDFLTNPYYGLQFPPSALGSFAVYQSMCLAAGLVISDALVSQTAANSYFGDLLDATNSEFVWSSGLLTIVPYGDVGAIEGNGYSYTPPSVPLFSLGDDDFMKNEGSSSIGVSSYTTDDPVIVTRTRRSDAMNDIQVEYLDRYASYIDPDTGDFTVNAYNPTIAEAMDEASIATWGMRRAAVKTMHFFCIGAAAIMAANLQLRRQSVIANYTFTLDQRYIVLDPMDLIEITDASIGLYNQPVLITEITENDDCSLTFFAEEYLGAASAIPAYGLQAGAGFGANTNVAPPATNPPVIFMAPPQIASNQGLEIWMVASGPTGWGGCDVWISGDGTTYQNVGRMIGPGRQGVLSAPVAASADPDTTAWIPVDLSSSDATLLSGTTTDADRANTLCYLDGELIAYSDADLTSRYHYTLDTYVRRGLYGTPITYHAPGAAFARLDSQVFQYPCSLDQIGTTLYVKLTAFNIYGGGEQGLPDVQATTLTIPPPPPPSNVTGFSVKESNNLVVFSWDPVTDFALRGYDIGYAPKGTTNWSEFLMLTEAGSGTEMTNADVPNGTWTFGIRARDVSGQVSPQITTADLIVMAQDVIIAEAEQAPIWPGKLSGFVRHYTGVLVPDDQNIISHYDIYTDFAGGFQPTPVTTASYIAPVIDQGFDDDNRVHATIGTGLNPGQSGTPTITLSIDTWLTAGSDSGTFSDWTIGYLNLRYLRAQITYNEITAGSVSYINEFEPIIDTGTPPINYTQQAAVLAGGTIVTFEEAFHLPPVVVPSVVAGSALYATASDITATDCMVNVWDTSGTSVGGTVTLSMTGE